jgi:hypothetical protein
MSIEGGKGKISDRGERRREETIWGREMADTYTTACPYLRLTPGPSFTTIVLEECVFN